MQTSPSSQRWWDLTAALLFMAAMLTAATRLTVTRWTLNLSIVQTLTFFGVIAGLALGVSRFSRRVAGLFAAIYGAVAIFWQLGLTLNQTTLENLPWDERLTILLERLRIIVIQLVGNEPIHDSLLFLLLMFSLYWVLATSGGYILTRHGDAWMAILPTGLALFVIHSFDALVIVRTWYLAVYLFFGLVLVARLEFIHHQSEWQKRHSALPPHLSLDFIRYALLAAGLIVILSWSAPALANTLPQAQEAFQPVRKAWTRTMGHFENIFAALKTTIPIYSPIYSSAMNLGRGGQLSDIQMFAVRAPANIPSGIRLYWRARLYETYDSGQWVSKNRPGVSFNPQSEPLLAPDDQGRWKGDFEFISAVRMGTLITPAQPLWVSRPGKVEYNQNPDKTLNVMSFIAIPPVDPGDVYAAQASLSQPTVEEMRASSTQYPEWVTALYLQVPSSVTTRTLQLAQQITAGLDNPYDKANAITGYLRTNITYTEALNQSPPPNQETIDWFLFDIKEGFCNYYATADVIMLRSLGIPARLAVGYAQGEPLAAAVANATPDRITYLVRQRDAHAWPEVYFSGLGWVEFEPTASQPVIQRTERTDPANLFNRNLPQEEIDRRQQRLDALEALRNQHNLEAAQAAAAQQNPLNVVYSIAFAALVAGLTLLALHYLPLVGLPSGPVLMQKMFVKVGLRPPALLERWEDASVRSVATFRAVRWPPLPILLEKVFQRLGLKTPRWLQTWARQAELPPLSKAYLEINRALTRLGAQPAVTDTPAERADALARQLPPLENPARRLVREYQIGMFSQQPVDLPAAQVAAAIIRRVSFQSLFQRILARFQRPKKSPL